jgi:hypothetical protein
VDWPPYPAALRLYAIAEERWPEIDAAYYQVNLIEFPCYRFLNCVYTWCLARLDPEKREEWDAMLMAPLDPSKKAKPTDAQIEAEGADFMALMGQQMPGKAGA